MRAIVLPLWLLSATALAAGGTALDAFNFVTGARAGGMGGAATAVAADATALQWNPAGLARASAFNLTLSHLFWVSEIQTSYAGAVVPLASGRFGLPVDVSVGGSVQYFNYGTIESTRGLAPAADASDTGGTAGAGLRLGDSIAAGAAVKVFSHALGAAHVSEAAADLGAAIEAVPDTFTLGMVVQNVGWSGKLAGRSAPLPSAVRGGAAWRFRAGREPAADEPGWQPDVHALVAGDVIAWQRGEPVAYAVGGEADLNGWLFARAGYQQPLGSAGAGAGLSFGGGVRVRGLTLDYAFASVGDLGRAQYVTLSYGPRPAVLPAPPVAAGQTPATIAAEEYALAAEEYAAGRKDKARQRAAAAVEADPSHWQAWQLLGNCRYDAGDPAGAREAFARSLELHPDNPALKAFLDRLAAPARPEPAAP